MRTFCNFLLAGLLALFVGAAYGQARVNSVIALNAATATGEGEVHQVVCTDRTFHVYGATTAGAGSVTVVIEASDLPSPATSTRVDWVTLGTVTLTLSTTRTGDGFASQARWRHVRPYVTAISGTGANVTAYIGC
jgi:hypothetical protein